MNPFLESTVATPQPGARWRPGGAQGKPTPARGGVKKLLTVQNIGPRRSGQARRRAGKCDERVSAHDTVSSTRRPRGKARNGASSLRRVCGALRTLMLTGSLLMPGLLHAIDVNTASLQQLQEVKGIGPKTASLIIEERDRGGRFESMKDVSERVKGIGPKKASALEAAGLTVGAASTSAKEPDSGGRPARRAR